MIFTQLANQKQQKNLAIRLNFLTSYPRICTNNTVIFHYTNFSYRHCSYTTNFSNLPFF